MRHAQAQDQGCAGLQSAMAHCRPAFNHRPNHLPRQFTVDAPDKAWVTDITYIRTWQGWLYLAAVVDLYSRKVVGWSMKVTLSRDERQCDARGYAKHSDRDEASKRAG